MKVTQDSEQPGLQGVLGERAGCRLCEKEERSGV